MAKGLSVHVGVNRVNAPGIDVPELRGCESDAWAMNDIARAAGFISDGPILNEKARFDSVIEAIESAASQLSDGDIFLFTFAGHGVRRGAQNLLGEEDDLKDESIVLHDRILLDDVFKSLLWPEFKEGVRILAVADSCHSGSTFLSLSGPTLHPVGFPDPGLISTANLGGSDSSVLQTLGIGEVTADTRVREIPAEQKEEHLRLLEPFFKGLRERIDSKPESERIVKASLLTLAACKDGETTADNLPHGVFTQALIDVWGNGSFDGNYADFRNAIQQELLEQTPVLLPKKPNPAFAGQRPFTLLPPQ